MNSLGVTIREISIAKSVTQHFEDIGHDMQVHDVTYENGQARERTQILMDLSNQLGGLVIGTGDLSELALGWATYNGDHMSMYGVNASIPKTLIKYLVEFVAKTVDDKSASTLFDIIATPISPELRAPRLLPLLFPALRLQSPQDLHAGLPCLRRYASPERRVDLFRGDNPSLASHVLPPLLCPAVQAFLPARRT